MKGGKGLRAVIFLGFWLLALSQVGPDNKIFYEAIGVEEWTFGLLTVVLFLMDLTEYIRGK